MNFMVILDIVQKYDKEGQNVILRSQNEKFKPVTDIYKEWTLWVQILSFHEHDMLS